jgi:hypothetical protein
MHDSAFESKGRDDYVIKVSRLALAMARPASHSGFTESCPSLAGQNQVSQEQHQAGLSVVMKLAVLTAAAIQVALARSAGRWWLHSGKASPVNRLPPPKTSLATPATCTGRRANSRLPLLPACHARIL